VWKALLARREHSWVEELPSWLAKHNVPRAATAAWLLEALLGAALLVVGVVAVLAL
jgi:hypothetical protein